jgi:hypothetical protein
MQARLRLFKSELTFSSESWGEFIKYLEILGLLSVFGSWISPLVCVPDAEIFTHHLDCTVFFYTLPIHWIFVWMFFVNEGHSCCYVSTCSRPWLWIVIFSDILYLVLMSSIFLIGTAYKQQSSTILIRNIRWCILDRTSSWDCFGISVATFWFHS